MTMISSFLSSEESSDLVKDQPAFDAWSVSGSQRCGTYNAELPQGPRLELDDDDDEDRNSTRNAPSVITTTPSETTLAQLERLGLADLREADGKLQQLLERILDQGVKEHWLIQAEHLCLHPQCILGMGSYGVVVAAQLHGTPVVVKVPCSARLGTHMRRLPALVTELRVLRRLRHPNVGHLYGACIEPTSGELFLVLQWINGS